MTSCFENCEEIFHVNVKPSRFLFLILAWTSVLHGAAESDNADFKEHQDFESTVVSSLDAKKISNYYEHLSNTTRAVRIRNKGDLAIHRGLGKHLDKTVQYRLIQEAFVGSMKLCKLKNNCKVLDAGCGMGAAMVFFAELH